MKLHYSQSMSFHGKRAIEFLNFEPYDPKSDKNEPTMFWLYTPEDYKSLYLHEGKSYVFWHGIDVLYLRQHVKNFLPIIRKANPVCACHNELQQNFLAEMGIYAHVRPVFWNDLKKYALSKKPLTKQVFITSHPGREAEYGESMINAVAAALRDWTFHIFGTEKTLPVYDNVIYHGNLPEEKMDEITKNHAATIRWKHINGQHWDGVSQTVIKALLRGQIAITGIKYPFAHHATGINDIVSYLKNHENLINDLPKIRLNEFDWLESSNFDYKRYWEKRYRSGGNSGSGSYGALADFKADVVNEFIKTNSIESTIDFGCGDGNQISLIDCRNYVGLDVSETAVKICKEKFNNDPNKRFFLCNASDYEDLDIGEADLVLCLDVLYHIIDENDFVKTLDAIFRLSKKYVILYAILHEPSIRLSQHLKYRDINNYLNRYPQFELFEIIDQKYPDLSLASFIVFKKKHVDNVV